MNPWAILAAVLLVGALTGGAYRQGRADGEAKIEAQQAREDSLALAAAESAASAAAVAISRIEVRNVVVNKALEREVLTREVFRDCRSGADAVRLLNATPGIAQAAGSAPAGGGELPATGTAR